MASKGLRKKIEKQPLRSEDIRAEGQVLEYGTDDLADFDVVPYGRFEEDLFNKLTKQRNEIREGQEYAQYSLEGMTGLKRKRISFPILIRPEGAHPSSSPQRIRVDIKNIYIKLLWSELCCAADANTAAFKEMKQGRIEDSFNYYIRAERSLGAASAFNRVEKVVSRIGMVKAKSRHTKTDDIRAQAIKLWRDEVDPNLSAQKAADELLGRIRWPNGKDVPHRTIAKWIATEKKKASSPK
jgi:hypothetical protein